MSNNIHKSELSEINGAILTDIDLLPLHPKNKIALYNRYLLSKLSWHFTVANLPKTWVCEHLDNVVAQYIRKWLDLPISATLSNIILPQNKFGLNFLLPSTKFVQCQTVLRNALKTSQNDDIKHFGSLLRTALIYSMMPIGTLRRSWKPFMMSMKTDSKTTWYLKVPSSLILLRIRYLK